MIGDWLAAVPPFLVVLAFIIIPGTVVRLAGWSARPVGLYFLAPAISVAIVAVSAALADVIGVPWSPLPVAVLTIVAGAAAYALRRWVGPEHPAPPAPRQVVAASAGFLAASVIIVAQLTSVFIGPEHISQTFDNVVHLNSIRYALDAGSASPWTIGATSDIGFYPNAWHALVTMSAAMTGAGVPVAVNATNVAIGAVVWPASCMALGAALFRDRATALVASGALATGFGAFPILLMFFGVLYPNATGYSLIAAGLAALCLLLRARSTPHRVRAAVLLLVVCAGVGLGHPNAFLALFALGTFSTLVVLMTAAMRARSRTTWIVNGAIGVVLLAAGAALWRFSRTPWEMSRWGPWQGTGDALREALFASPGDAPLTPLVSLLIVAGLIAAVVRPRWVVVVVPFAVAGFMFVLVSGTPRENFLREMVTNPWYNDSYRLAALLPIAAIPVATLGAVAVVSMARRLVRRLSVPRALPAVIAPIAAAALFSVGFGPNVLAMADSARVSYQYTETAPLLSTDEKELLSRLDDSIPPDAVIAANPWTGGSLAYALADREVLERHMFGSRSEDEELIDTRLRYISTDSRVCEAVTRLGVTHVLDFGSQNVFNDPGQGLDRRGLNDLEPSDELVLVDAEGSARLFKIEGC